MVRQTRFENRVLWAFAAAMAVAVSLAVGAWTLSRGAAQAVAWVTHTQSVINCITNIQNDTLQAELSTQGYRVTGVVGELVERDQAVTHREMELARLHDLVEKDPEQSKRWSELRQLVDQRIAISREVERLRRSQGADAATAYVKAAPLQATRIRIHGLLGELGDAERARLTLRQHEYELARERMVVTGALMASVLILTLTVTYLLIRRQFMVNESSRQALALSQKSLAITLDTIGSAVLVTDEQGRISRMNPAAELMTGWAQSDALGHPFEEVIITAGDDGSENTTAARNALTTGQDHRADANVTLVSRSGGEHAVSQNISILRHADGAVAGLVIVIHDVGELRQAQRDSENHLASIINAVRLLIAYVDADQRYVYFNDQYRECFVPDQRNLSGHTVAEVLGAERYAVALPLIEKALAGHPQSIDWQPFPDIWQNISYVPRRNPQGKVEGYYVLGVDITERKMAEEHIGQLNRQLASRIVQLEQVSGALRTLSAGNRAMVRAKDKQELLDNMCRVLVSNGDYRFSAVWYCNYDKDRTLQLRAQCGYPGGNEALAALRPSWADNERGATVIGEAIRYGRVSIARDLQTNPRYQLWQQYLYGAAAGIAFPLRVADQVIGAIAIYSDRDNTFNDEEVELLAELADDLALGISLMRSRAEQQRTQEAMRMIALQDPLTGLPNETRLRSQLDEATTAGRPFALLQINIERLREINAALGFSQGDQLLREFGRRLTQCVPPDVKVARLRGDEFAVLLPGDQAQAMPVVLDRIERVMAQRFVVADIELDVQIRTGIAVFPEHGATSNDLLRHVDMATRQAKLVSQAHAVFDASRESNPVHRLNFVGELRRGIENGELELHLQPKVNMQGGQLESAEALVRWRHPTRGMIPPAEFISLAEQTGLIQPLTEWVVNSACRINEEWLRQGCALPIAVNLSARNLREDSLLARIRQLHGLWPDGRALLEVEITESAAMENPEVALRALEDFRNQGIPLYIDDFGTGYSSLSYLLKLPVEFIKIDQSFVRTLPGDANSLRIVRSIVDLAHDLGRRVVAEGVETRAQWDILCALRCDHAQGYFIARPMPVAAFSEWRDAYQPIH